MEQKDGYSTPKVKTARAEQNELRRRQANEKYERLFYERDLDRWFDYVGFEDKDHIRVRCKRCGVETTRTKDAFVGRTSRIICRECKNGTVSYSDEVDSIIKYYEQGHTTLETCEKFGLSQYKLQFYVKARGVSNGRTISEINAGKAKSAALASLPKREDKARILIEARGFEYLGGFTRHNSAVLTKCKRCGEIRSRSMNFFRRGAATCDNCKRREAEKKKRKVDDGEKYRNEILKAFDIKSSGYQRTIERKLDKKRRCPVCGNPYTIRYWKALTGSNYSYDPGVCSMACRKILKNEREKERRKVQGRNGTTRKRCKQYGVEYSGHKITWQTYAKRHGLDPNNLVCALCGKICDPNDHSWSAYTGPLHPSIDHIIPLHRGGGDNWENVQIACMECNSRKGDKIAKEVKAV